MRTRQPNDGTVVRHENLDRQTAPGQGGCQPVGSHAERIRGLAPQIHLFDEAVADLSGNGTAGVREGHEGARRSARELGFLANIGGNRHARAVPSQPGSYERVTVIRVFLDGQRRADEASGCEAPRAQRGLPVGVRLA